MENTDRHEIGPNSICNDNGEDFRINYGNSGVRFYLKIVFAAVVVFVIVYGIAATALRGVNAVRRENRVSSSGRIPPSEAALVVYNFYNGERFVDANRVDTYTRALIRYDYPDGLAVYAAINLDDPENEHYFSDFEIKGPCVVMMTKDGFERIDDIYGLVRNEARFIESISSGMKRMISGR